MPSIKFAPFLTLNAPAASSHELLVNATISLAEAQHSIAVVTVLIPLAADRQVLDAAVPSYLVWPDRTPVKFTYGSSVADSYTWYGYVASHQVLSGAGSTTISAFPTVPVQYTLTGASMTMQDAKSRVFSAQSASSIARQIAAGDRFALATGTHPRLLPGSAQSRQSDFGYLTWLAGQVGWRFWPDNGLLYFIDPVLAVAPPSTAPVLVRNNLPGSRDTLTSFTSTVGETDPSGAILAAQSTYTLRSSSGQLARSTTIPLRTAAGQQVAPQFTQISAAASNSYTEAGHVTAAAAANSRYWVAGSAVCDGNTALRPGRLARLAGGGLRAADQGLWRICSAEHQITLSPMLAAHNMYTVNLGLVRDQESSLTVVTPRTAISQPGPMTLVGAVWVAS